MKILLLLLIFLLYISVASAQTFKYDDLDRVTEIKYSDNTVCRFAYDANGNRVSQITTTPIVTAVPNLDTNITKLLVFPNPTPDIVTVQLELNYPDNVTITLYTLEGRLLRQERFSKVKSLNYALPVGISRGIYEVVITTSRGRRAWKVEKQ